MACLPCTPKAAHAAQDAPHERCVTALLAPPWVFVHEAYSRHFYLKLMTVDHLRCSNLAALVDAYSLEARKDWSALGLPKQRKACSPFLNTALHSSATRVAHRTGAVLHAGPA